jgi:hypothetical protein
MCHARAATRGWVRLPADTTAPPTRRRDQNSFNDWSPSFIRGLATRVFEVWIVRQGFEHLLEYAIELPSVAGFLHGNHFPKSSSSSARARLSP